MKVTTKDSSSKRDGGRSSRPARSSDRRPSRPREQVVPEYEQKILELARVTRVTAGGKRMRFRATLVIGDRKGKVGIGIAKGADVSMAIEKAYRQAKKRVFLIPMHNETIPHLVRQKFGAAKILLKPAPRGTGLKAGGAVRMLLELGGVPNAVSKSFGSNNKINIAKATCAALRRLTVPVKKQASSTVASTPAA